MTAGKAAFGANAAEEEHQACQITALLKNLTNTLIHKNLTMDKLVASIAQLAQALQEMQAAMVRMFPASQTHAQLHYQPPTWVPNPPEAAVPPAAPPALTMAKRGLRLFHWGSVKPAWDKQGHWWSHRHKGKDGHTSATCSSPRKGHQPGTREYLQRGVLRLLPRTASSPNLTMQNSGSCCR